MIVRAGAAPTGCRPFVRLGRASDGVKNVVAWEMRYAHRPAHELGKRELGARGFIHPTSTLARRHADLNHRRLQRAFPVVTTYVVSLVTLPVNAVR